MIFLWSQQTGQRARTRPSSRARYRPQLEALEERTTPTGDFGFAVAIGSNSFDEGKAVALDSAGNIYTTGQFRETVDFDPGPGTFHLTSVPAAASAGDFFVSKLDNAGNFVWARALGTNGHDQGFGIAVDAAGNVYAAGVAPRFTFWKLDSAGNTVWVKSLDGGGAFHQAAVAVDAVGNVHVTCFFSGTMDFDPGPGTFNLTATDSDDAFVFKWDSAGNFVWARSFAGSFSSTGTGIAVDGSGNVYSTGHFSNTTDFDPGPGTFNLSTPRPGLAAGYVSKLDSAGNFVWAKSLGGPDGSLSRAIALDGSGNVHITGRFGGRVDFDPGPGTFELTAGSSGDAYVCKLSSAGAFVWAADVGGGEGFGVAVGGDRVFAAGTFFNGPSFGPDIFVSELSSAGAIRSTKIVGGSDADQASAVAADAAGNVYATGYFKQTVDFDPGNGTFFLSSNAGSLDQFVLKLVQPPKFQTQVAGDGQVFLLDERGQLWRYRLGDQSGVASGGYGLAIDVANDGDGNPANDIVFMRASDSRIWVWNQQFWTQTIGYLPDVLAGDNQVFAIGFDNQVWRFHVQNGWTATGGYGIAIDIGNDGDGDAANDLLFMKGVDSAIWLWDQLSWRFTGGWLDKMVAGDNQLFCLGYDGQAWQFHVSSGWRALGGYGVAIDVGNLGDGSSATDVLFLRGVDNRIYVWNQQFWSFTGGSLATLTAADNQLFGIGLDDQVWRFHVQNGWTAGGGYGIDIDVGSDADANAANDLVFLLAADHTLWVWDQLGWTFTGA